MFLQGSDHPGRRRKPCVEHVRVDNVPVAIQRIELLADGREERAAVKAGRRPAKRNVGFPVNFTFKSLQQSFEAGQPLAQRLRRRLQDLVGDRAGLHGQTHPFQAQLEVKIENLPPANRHDAAASVRLDPAERGIHQQDCQLPPPIRLADGQDADLVQFVVKRKRHSRSLEIFVDRVSPARGRRHADKSGQFISDGGRDVNVEFVERIVEPAAVVARVLRQFRRVDLVAHLIDHPAFAFRCQSDLDPASTGRRGNRA